MNENHAMSIHAVYPLINLNTIACCKTKSNVRVLAFENLSILLSSTGVGICNSASPHKKF